MDHECVWSLPTSGQCFFDATHWFTGENNKLHSTALTFYGLTWIKIYIYSDVLGLEILISRLTGLSTVMARDIFVMPFVSYFCIY